MLIYKAEMTPVSIPAVRQYFVEFNALMIPIKLDQKDHAHTFCLIFIIAYKRYFFVDTEVAILAGNLV